MLRTILSRGHVQEARNPFLFLRDFRFKLYITKAQHYQQRNVALFSKTKVKGRGNDKGIEGTKKTKKAKDPDVEFMKLWKSSENNYKDRLRGTVLGKRVTKRRNKDVIMETLPSQSEMSKEEASQLMEDSDIISFRVPKFGEIINSLGLANELDLKEKKSEERQILDTVKNDVSFEDIGVHPKLIERLKKNGIIKPVFIQEKALPLLYDKKSVLIKSETGSGKTFVFLLPTLQDPGKSYGTVIIVPTRELASQMLYEAHRLLGDKSIVTSFVSFLFIS
jgi:ATP-dependent RNA helicase DeaD